MLEHQLVHMHVDDTICAPTVVAQSNVVVIVDGSSSNSSGACGIIMLWECIYLCFLTCIYAIGANNRSYINELIVI